MSAADARELAALRAEVDGLRKRIDAYDQAWSAIGDAAAARRRGPRPRDRHGLRLAAEVAGLRTRLDAQDQAWTTWREVNGRIAGPARAARLPRDRHGLRAVGGGQP